jgi:N-acyl-phosphatidylethanolamine-hydrolysing phospholipase D
MPSTRVNGRYVHDPEVFPGWEEHGFAHFRKWRRTVERPPTLSAEELQAKLPVRHVSKEMLRLPPADAMQCTWLGHASVLTQFDGWNILADPIFSDRCSPVQWAGPQRVRPSPIESSALPRIDAVVISHSHYDHLDLESVKALAALSPPPMWFVPLGTKAWMASVGVANVVEMDWGQQAVYIDPSGTKQARELTVTCLPCQHWCARTPWDRNTMLWSSWMTSTAPAGGPGSAPEHSYYFGGDTGYCGSVFAAIGAAFGHVDVAAIPIGAYGSPSETWLHRTSHMNPEEAAQTRRDLRARHGLAVHWGTFQLTSEPLLEPPARLKAALTASESADDAFVVLDHGETRCFPCGLQS